MLFNGETINYQNNEITNFSFSKTDFILKNYTTNTTTQTKTQEISTTDLFVCFQRIYNFEYLKFFK